MLLFTMGIVLLGCVAWGALHFLTSRTEDQSYLTERYAAIEVESEKAADQFVVVYSYSVDDATYFGKHRFQARNWGPGDPINVCVDPVDVATHAITYDGCGNGALASETRQGKTTEPGL
jgi:hypothetical protein